MSTKFLTVVLLIDESKDGTELLRNDMIENVCRYVN